MWGCRPAFCQSLGALILAAQTAHAAPSAPTDPAAWNLNDVSYLFPLNASIPARSKATHGAWIPQDRLAALFEHLTEYADRKDAHSDAADFLQNLKLVGARLNPQTLQVQAVFQPVVFDNTRKRLTTLDRAAHAFYQLDPVSFVALVEDLWDLKQWGENLLFPIRTNALALQVHPGFSNTLRRTEFRTRLVRAFSNHCGASTLVQLTAMIDLTPSSWWRFAGLEKQKDGTWKPMTIPRAEKNSIKQDLFNFTQEFDAPEGFGVQMRVAVTPELDLPKDQNLSSERKIEKQTTLDLMSAVSGYHALTEADLPVATSAWTAIRRYENPRIHSPRNLDCVSCHLAEPARAYLRLHLPASEPRANAVHERFDLRNLSASPRSSKIVRAFGYFGPYPAINQRVIHESAEAALALGDLKRRSR